MKIMTYLFSGFLILLLIANIVTPTKTFSDTENRYLAQMPKVSMKKIIDGSFSKEFESYIQDQFFLRDFWVTLKVELEVLMNKKDNNGAYIGKDNWYFERKEEPTILDKNISVISEFSNWTKENNINSTFLPVYSSYTIYNEYTPKYSYVFNELDAFKNIRDINNINIVDIYSNLISNKDEYIYFKTDHHWTQRGAFYAYQKLGEVMDFIPYEITDFNCNYISNEFYGSLYSKAPLWNIEADKVEIFQIDKKYLVEYLDTEEIEESLYRFENINKKDKYTIFLGGNNSLIKINTNVYNNKKLLILKDSFSHVVIPFLANHYEEIHIVDLRYYKQSIKDFIFQNDITDLLFIYNISWFADDKNIISLKY